MGGVYDARNNAIIGWNVFSIFAVLNFDFNVFLVFLQVVPEWHMSGGILIDVL